jgi:tetratricopeptide (TPR) repeat protein
MRHFWDQELPPPGWQPTEASLKRMREEPAIDLDRHLGGEIEEARGLAWLASQQQSTAGAAAAVVPQDLSPSAVAEQVHHLRERARAAPIEEAVVLLERAAGLAPDNRDLLLELGDAYSASQRSRDAVQVLEKVIALFGTQRTRELASYHHRLASALSQLGDKEVALAQLDRAFMIDPGSVSVLRDLGVLAFETNDLERAQKTFRALLLQRLDGSSGISKGEVFFYLGAISAKQGDKARAVSLYKQAIETEPSLSGKAGHMLADLEKS